MAIAYANIAIELREVLLSCKPEALLAISSKATVPVLQCPGGEILDESIDIMHWALAVNDPDGWIDEKIFSIEETKMLLKWNDGEFKHFLDRYKYADRYPAHPANYYRRMAEPFLVELENRLHSTRFLCGEQTSLADIAIFPFIRQFAAVDKQWFDHTDFKSLNNWLQRFIQSALFSSVMKKYRIWKPRDNTVLFGKLSQETTGK